MERPALLGVYTRLSLPIVMLAVHFEERGLDSRRLNAALVRLQHCVDDMHNALHTQKAIN